MLTNVHIDFETYSVCNIFKAGSWAYSCHESTEVICMAYKIGDAPPKLWLLGEPIPEFVRNVSGYQLHAWNSLFEIAIWVNVLGWAEVPIEQWTDTAALAAALALPRALGNCGAAMGISSDSVKDKRGKYLIQRLCKPVRGKRIRDPELLQELHDYCKQDTVAEHAISRKLRPLNGIERRVWEIDQLVNMRGVYVDSSSVDAALEMIDQETDILNREVEDMTGGALINMNQRVVAMGYCAARGVELESYTKGYLSSLLEDPYLDPHIKRLIEIRLMTGKTSTAKYRALKLVTTEDDRARGLLMYHGASTGRWSGRHFQPQNIPRPSLDVEDVDNCIELFKHNDSTLVGIVYDDAMEAMSSCLRGMLTAPDGRTLLVCDYSQIEARVLPWLAGAEKKLDVFRAGNDVYKHSASDIYKKPEYEISKDERFVGKVAELALGYQGGKVAFQNMAEIYGVEIPEAQAEKIKVDWREANPEIVTYWADINEAAISAVKKPNTTFVVRGVKFRVIKSFLFIKLPSSRMLAYYQPKIGEARFGGDCVTFMGTNSVTRKWERQSTYGGKLVENITQAVARDIMAEAMIRVTSAGYEIVLSVHDELIAEVDELDADVESFQELMCDSPEWATGLPIAADGFVAKRYRK